MRSENYDRRITVLRYALTLNSDNEPIETYTADAERPWVAVEYVSDGEKIRAGEVGATLSVRFTTRWTASAASINPKDRVEFEGQTFDIFSAKPTKGRRQEIEITAATAADE